MLENLYYYYCSHKYNRNNSVTANQEIKEVKKKNNKIVKFIYENFFADQENRKYSWLIIILFVFLCSTISFVFNIDSFIITCIYIGTSMIFIIYTLFLLFASRKEKKRKHLENIIKYQNNMKDLKIKFDEINIGDYEAYELIIGMVEKELDNKRSKLRTLFKNVSRFMTVIVLPMIVVVFNTVMNFLRIDIPKFKISSIDELFLFTNEFSKLGILLIFAILEVFLIYIAILELSEIKSLKVMRLEAMRDDMKWIKACILSNKDNISS